MIFMCELRLTAMQNVTNVENAVDDGWFKKGPKSDKKFGVKKKFLHSQSVKKSVKNLPI